MAAFAQSFGQTLGRAGNDYGSAVDANLNTALAVIQNKLTMQEIQQQMRAQDQRMAAEAIRMKQMQVPQLQGTYQTPQGIYGVTYDPNTGKTAGSLIPGSEQFFAPPAELSPESIHKFVGTLPDYIDKEGTEQTILGYVHQGMFKEALSLMGKGAEMRPTGSAQTLEQAKQFATDSGYTPYSPEWYDAVRILWRPGLAERKTISIDPYGQPTTTTSQRPLPTPQNAPQNVPRGTPNNNVPLTPSAATPTLPQIAESTPPEGLPWPTDLPPMRSDLQIPTPSRRTAAPTSTATAAPPPTAPPTATPSQAPSGAPPKAEQARQLDENFHIPVMDAVKRRLNPNLVAAANQLLDGMSIKDLKIPPKDAQAAANLAGEYGWSQGKFTPREWLLVRESASILNQARSSDALKVLDEDWFSRQKVIAALFPAHNAGRISSGISSAAAMNLTPRQQEFVRLYNQMVGRISGLSQLVRSGRATESQIERLKLELPNPLSTTNSTDANRRIDLILNEISIAEKKGSFQGVQSSTEFSPALKNYMKQRGIPVP